MLKPRTREVPKLHHADDPSRRSHSYPHHHLQGMYAQGNEKNLEKPQKFLRRIKYILVHIIAPMPVHSKEQLSRTALIQELLYLNQHLQEIIGSLSVSVVPILAAVLVAFSKLE